VSYILKDKIVILVPGSRKPRVLITLMDLVPLCPRNN